MAKSTTDNKNGFAPLSNGGSQRLLHSQWEYIATFAKSIRIYKFNECSPENLLIMIKFWLWVLTKNLLINAQLMYIQLRFYYE